MYVSLFILEFFEKNQMTVLEQPSYLPDLANCVFFLFSRVKYVMRGENLDDIEGIK